MKNGQRRIDLHTHSTASDGTDSPARLMEKGASLGLSALALTDHDTVAGLAAAHMAADKFGIEFIPGCEISTITAEGRFHVVGLWVSDTNPDLNAYLDNLREKRSRRNEQVVSLLQTHGVSITMDELKKEAGDGDPAKGSPSIGRPHMASLLLRKGIVKSRDEAFEKWLGKNGLAYIPKPVPSTEEAVEFLADIGAAPILAHPLLNSVPAPELWNLIRRLKEKGLFGLEAWHSTHSPVDTARLLELAARFDLGISGGSDYHGLNKPQINLGTGKGNLNLTCGILEELKKRFAQKAMV